MLVYQRVNQRYGHTGVTGLTGRGGAQETLPDEVASHGGGRGTATAGAPWEPWEPCSYGHLSVISTKKTPFIECIIPFITSHNW